MEPQPRKAEVQVEPDNPPSEGPHRRNRGGDISKLTTVKTTHPHIDRLYDLGTEELSISMVASVLLKQRRFVHRLIDQGKLEVIRERTRKDEGAGKERYSYIITAAAVIRYVVAHTTGDKVVILSAIKQRFPHHAHLFALLMSARPEEPAPAPGNLIAFPSRLAALRTLEPAPKPEETQLDLFKAV